MAGKPRRELAYAEELRELAIGIRDKIADVRSTRDTFLWRSAEAQAYSLCIIADAIRKHAKHRIDAAASKVDQRTPINLDADQNDQHLATTEADQDAQHDARQTVAP